MESWRKAIEKLRDGNARFASARMEHVRRDRERREELAGGQNPFAVVLTCSDSRVVPEVLFDQGLGDLFVICVAGNIVDDVVAGTIEYAAAHLATPLVVVLGHSSCGAITATAAGGEPEGHMACLTEALRPAVDAVRSDAGDLVNNAAKANARMVADQLSTLPPILSEQVARDALKVVPAYYNIVSGEVDFLDID